MLILLIAGMVSGASLYGQTTQTSSVIGAGATEASGDGLIVRGTVGEGVIGLTTASAIRSGQGFWYTLGNESSSSVRETQVASGGASNNDLQCYPNPVSSVAHFQLTVSEGNHATLRLYDRLGRVRTTLVDGQREAGKIVVEMTVDELDAGHYTAELVVGKDRVVRQILIIQ